MNSQADAYIRPMDYYLVPFVVDPSGVLHSFNYILNHLITEKNKATQSLMVLLELIIPSLEFLKAALCGFLVYFVLFYSFVFCLRRFFKKPKGSNLQIKIFAFAYLIYWFFINQFYNDILNTSSVTVDLSDILHSEERILNSDRIPCFFEVINFLLCLAKIESFELRFSLRKVMRWRSSGVLTKSL